ncbi:uncharacterized protein LOC143024093 isoform X2 [Oratosquilla oratoria]|uniref:uncharacterized protein LOC143024093 isoform X2 n=1 Tax=Oratosquilla oratoria TaxID=337810 RepID=UPI003F757911
MSPWATTRLWSRRNFRGAGMDVATVLCLVMSPVPLMSPGSENGSAVVRPPQSKMDSIKTWSITTYKCMRQPTHLRETGQARAHVPLTQVRKCQLRVHSSLYGSLHLARSSWYSLPRFSLPFCRFLVLPHQ